MDYEDNELKNQLFYDVPPASPDHRFYSEILSKGQLDWNQFKQGATMRGHNHQKYQEITFPPFTLIGVQWKMIARLSWYTKWGSRVGPQTLQVCISPQSGKMPENFRITLGVSLWAAQSFTKYTLLDKVSSKIGHVYGFEEFKVLDNYGLPGQGYMHGLLSNLTCYVRLEVGNSRLYPLTTSNPLDLEQSDHEECCWQMTLYNHDYQDSTLFELAGAKWRLFYCRKPETKLLLQRMPDSQAGNVGVDFDLFGVKDGRVIVQDYMEHEFNEGFNDWGITDDVYQRCTAVGVRVRYFDGRAYGNEPTTPSVPQTAVPGYAPGAGSSAHTEFHTTPLHAQAAASSDGARAQGQDYAPPAGPPPEKEQPPSYQLEN